jgi:hypothetical protein
VVADAAMLVVLDAVVPVAEVVGIIVVMTVSVLYRVGMVSVGGLRGRMMLPGLTKRVRVWVVKGRTAAAVVGTAVDLKPAFAFGVMLSLVFGWRTH